jgi:hypothetical protein
MEPVVAAPAVAPAKEKKARTKKAKEPKPEPVEAPESEHARIKAFFFAAFAEAKGEEPAWDGRSGKALKMLIDSFAAGPDRVERIQRLIGKAFSDKWFVEKTASIFELSKNATRYQGAVSRQASGRIIQSDFEGHDE